MNLLARAYQDEAYSSYIDLNPSLSACITGSVGKELRALLVEPEDAEYKICKTFADDFGKFRPKKLKNPTAAAGGSLLKSDWCYKHQHERFSSIVIVGDWEQFVASNVSREFLSLVREAKRQLEHSNCKVIIAFLSGTETKIIDDSRMAEITSSLADMVGKHFYSAQVISKVAAGSRSAAKLRATIVEAGLQYHTAEVRRLREKRRLLSAAVREDGGGSAASAMVRNHFKTGWHRLVMNDFFEARNEFDKAHKIIRLVAPKFPSLEARICASIILWHSASLAPLCGEDLSSTAALIDSVLGHIEWVGQAFTGGYSPNCRVLLRTLRAFLAAEWYDFLANNAQNAGAATRRDYFFAGANCLQEAVKDVPAESDRSLEIPSPPFIGTECANDAYSGLIDTISCGEVAQKIFELLDKGVSLTAAAAAGGVRGLEREYLQFAVNDIIGMQMDVVSGSIDNIISQNWRSDLIITSLCMSIASTHVGDVRAKLYASLHILASSSATPELKYTQTALLAGLPADDCSRVILEYPRGNLAAPLTILPSFNCSACESVREQISVQLTLSSTMAGTVTLSEIVATVVALSNADKEFEVDFPPTKTDICGRPVHMCTIEQTFKFPRSGNYVCKQVAALASIENISFRVTFIFDQAQTLKRLNIPSSSSPRRCAVIHVSKPASFAALNFCNQDVFECVEGQCLEIPFAAVSLGEALHECSIALPVRTKLFALELHELRANWTVERVRSSATTADNNNNKIKPDAAMQVYKIPGFAHFAPSSQEFILRCRGLKNGVFIAPVVFCYSTAGFANLRVVKHLRFFVDPPFSAVHTMCALASRSSESGDVCSLDTDTLNSRVEKNILLRTKLASIPASPADTQTTNLSLYYAAIDERRSYPDSRPFELGPGESAFVNSRISCTSRGGLTVQKINIICGPSVELLSTSVGPLPCFVEEGETVSVVARIRQKSSVNGLVSPGFLRVICSPLLSPNEALGVDLPMPSIYT